MVRRLTFLFVTCFAMTPRAFSSDLSIWKSLEELKTSWGASNFSINCGGEAYNIRRSILGSIAISIKGKDGNWQQIGDAQFSDTSVSFPSNYWTDGRFFYDDVVRLKSVQSSANDLIKVLTKQLEQKAQKHEEERLKDKGIADRALTKCENDSVAKYRPQIEKEMEVFKDNSSYEDLVNQSVGIQVLKACMKFRNKVSEIEFAHLADPTPPKPNFDVVVNSSNRAASTNVDFQSGERSIRIVEAVNYSLKIAVGENTKELNSTLSPFDEIHTDQEHCSLFR